MDRNFICLDGETYKKIKELHRTQKSISDKFYFELEDAKNYKQLLAIIKKYIKFDERKTWKIWQYLINEFKWHRTKRKEQTVPNQWQLIFLIKIISNGGYYEREVCLKEILTDQQIITQVYQLEYLGFIISIRTKRLYGSRTIYIINPTIINEI